jgi:hypothetical protein
MMSEKKVHCMRREWGICHLLEMQSFARSVVMTLWHVAFCSGRQAAAAGPVTAAAGPAWQQRRQHLQEGEAGEGAPGVVAVLAGHDRGIGSHKRGGVRYLQAQQKACGAGKVSLAGRPAGRGARGQQGPGRW